MIISRKNKPRWANLLYWNEHYAPIKNIGRLFSDISKHDHHKNFCFRCLGYFSSPELLARNQKLCSREDFMSVVHVLPKPNSEKSHIKFREFSNTSKAPFVICANFESILEPIDMQNKHTHYSQLHKFCGAAAILCSYIPEINNQVMLFSGNAIQQ